MRHDLILHVPPPCSAVQRASLECKDSARDMGTMDTPKEAVKVAVKMVEEAADRAHEGIPPRKAPARGQLSRRFRACFCAAA